MYRRILCELLYCKTVNHRLAYAYIYIYICICICIIKPLLRFSFLLITTFQNWCQAIYFFFFFPLRSLNITVLLLLLLLSHGDASPLCVFFFFPHAADFARGYTEALFSPLPSSSDLWELLLFLFVSSIYVGLLNAKGETWKRCGVKPKKKNKKKKKKKRRASVLLRHLCSLHFTERRRKTEDERSMQGLASYL